MQFIVPASALPPGLPDLTSSLGRFNPLATRVPHPSFDPLADAVRQSARDDQLPQLLQWWRPTPIFPVTPANATSDVRTLLTPGYCAAVADALFHPDPDGSDPGTWSTQEDVSWIASAKDWLDRTFRPIPAAAVKPEDAKHELVIAEQIVQLLDTAKKVAIDEVQDEPSAFAQLVEGTRMTARALPSLTDGDYQNLVADVVIRALQAGQRSEHLGGLAVTVSKVLVTLRAVYKTAEFGLPGAGLTIATYGGYTALGTIPVLGGAAAAVYVVPMTIASTALLGSAVFWGIEDGQAMHTRVLGEWDRTQRQIDLLYETRRLAAISGDAPHPSDLPNQVEATWGAVVGPRMAPPTATEEFVSGLVSALTPASFTEAERAYQLAHWKSPAVAKPVSFFSYVYDHTLGHSRVVDLKKARKGSFARAAGDIVDVWMEFNEAFMAEDATNMSRVVASLHLVRNAVMFAAKHPYVTGPYALFAYGSMAMAFVLRKFRGLFYKAGCWILYWLERMAGCRRDVHAAEDVMEEEAARLAAISRGRKAFHITEEARIKRDAQSRKTAALTNAAIPVASHADILAQIDARAAMDRARNDAVLHASKEHDATQLARLREKQQVFRAVRHQLGKRIKFFELLVVYRMDASKVDVARLKALGAELGESVDVRPEEVRHVFQTSTDAVMAAQALMHQFLLTFAARQAEQTARRLAGLQERWTVEDHAKAQKLFNELGVQPDFVLKQEQREREEVKLEQQLIDLAMGGVITQLEAEAAGSLTAQVIQGVKDAFASVTAKMEEANPLMEQHLQEEEEEMASSSSSSADSQQQQQQSVLHVLSGRSSDFFRRELAHLPITQQLRALASGISTSSPGTGRHALLWMMALAAAPDPGMEWASMPALEQ